MNIFILDNDIDKCAEYHLDKHIVKMPLESAQMLCTTHWIQKYLGYVPRKINADERAILKTKKEGGAQTFSVSTYNGKSPLHDMGKTIT